MSDSLDESQVNQTPSVKATFDLLEESSTKIISARGTEEGLVIRIDGRPAWEEIVGELKSFLEERKKFFLGGEVSLEWLDRLPTKEQSDQIEALLKNLFNITLHVRKKILPTKNIEEQKKLKNKTVQLFDVDSGSIDNSLSERIEKIISNKPYDPEAILSVGVEHRGMRETDKQYLSKMTKALGEDPFFDDDANAKIIFGTVRSGQKIETPFSLIVIGDVNPGADLVAGGDIIVLGSLRGTAHAGAYDDAAYDRVIISLLMQPMQLRIGSVISRGSDVLVKGAEIARIDDRRIIVEAYNPRSLNSKKNY